MKIVLKALFALGFTAILIAQPKAPEYPPLDKTTRAAIIDSVAESLIDFYVFPDKGKETAKLLQRNLKKGEYDNYTGLPEFTARLTQDVQSVTHDKHLHVDPMRPEEVQFYQQTGEAEEPDSALVALQLERRKYSNFEFEKVERLEGNVGYIKFDGFIDAAWAGATAIATMNWVANCDALIFDLRENGGGSPSMIQLITSYLFEDKQHLNDFMIRDDKGDYTDQYWSHDYVPGPRMPDVPVYVLTSERTFSAAEEFSYNLQSMKRGAIVGDTTGGGAHPVSGYGFPDLLVQMAIPFGRAVNPVTKTNWEGVGVLPDLPCETENALSVAHADALKKLREKITDERQLAQIDWAIEGLEAETNFVTLTNEQMQSCTGDFGPRHVRLVDGKLFYQRDEREPYEMIPMSDHLFRFDDLDYFRLEIVIDANGKAQKLIGHYSDGLSDENERNK